MTRTSALQEGPAHGHMGTLAGAHGSPQTDTELASMSPPWGPTRPQRWGIPSCFSSSFKPSNDSSHLKNHGCTNKRCTQTSINVFFQLVTLLEHHLQTRRELQILPVQYQNLEIPGKAFCFPVTHPQNCLSFSFPLITNIRYSKSFCWVSKV